MSSVRLVFPHYFLNMAILLRGEERLSSSDYYFPFPFRELSRHIVREGSLLRIKMCLSFRDKWYNSNETIQLGLIVIFWTFSFRITCTSVEGHLSWAN